MTSLYATIVPHFTRDLLSPGLQVGYFDEGGVWQFLAPSLALRLPLRAIEWKNLVGVTQTIDRLPLHFVARPSEASGSAMPLVCVYVIKCEDMERYKAVVKAQIAQWIDRMNAARVDWMLLYVPLGTRAKRGSVSGAAGGGHTATSGVYKKIFERIKNDFAHKKNASVGSGSASSSSGGGGGGGGGASGSASEPSRMSNLSNLGSSLAGSIGGGGSANGVSVDRICKIDTLEGASVVGTQATNETQWTELLLKMRKCIMEAFECKCLQYEEEVRVLDAKRSLPTWDFGAFFVAKERLALMYQQTCLLDDAIRHLDELEAISQFLLENDKRFAATTASSTSPLTASDPIFTISALAIDMAATHTQIVAGDASPLAMRLYFFLRQIRTLYLMGDFRQLIQRATVFISSFYELLRGEQEQSRGELEWFQPHLWAAGACLEIAYACELSWSGHDYQISSASIPEGVSFALTPEVMAGLLGDILYLARRVLKKSARSNGWWTMASSKQPAADSAIDASAPPNGSPPWYATLRATFDADTPDLFQRCVWELSHLASLHFSRAGRHRLAVFLGGECARYHFRHREFESASRLFRSHARQSEEDKWWMLVSDCVKRICDCELALGRSAQAVAACFSMLEIAQASKAEVSRAYLDQLLTSLVQSLDQGEETQDGGPEAAVGGARHQQVKMGELIKPAMAIETMQSPESDLDYGDVRVTLSLTNQFPVGIHIESVRIRFARGDSEQLRASADGGTVMAEVSLVDESKGDSGCDGESVSPLPLEARRGKDASAADTNSLVELQEHNVYLYERASVNLIFLYGDVDVGRYVCTGLECSVAGNTFPLFTRQDLNAIQFEIPPRKSTLELEIDGPPLLMPASLEEICITVHTQDDVVHQGVLEIALPDDCSAVALSHARLHYPNESREDTEAVAVGPPHDSGDGSQEPRKKCTLSVADLAARTTVVCSVWLVVSDVDVAAADTGDDAQRPPVAVALAASLRYEAGSAGAKRHTELRRSERAFQVARPLVETVRLKRVDATRVFAAVTLTCNPQCGLWIRDYALLCHGITTDPAGDASAQRLRVVQDPNAHLRDQHLAPNETLHMVFGLELSATGGDDDGTADSAALRVSVEFDGASHLRWRTDSLLAMPLGGIHGAVYEIDVQPTHRSPCSVGEDVVFAVTVRRLDGSSAQEPQLLVLDAASDGDWVLLGKQRVAFAGARFATLVRLLPLRVGRLRFPQFALRAVPRARVFCAQRARALLVVT